MNRTAESLIAESATTGFPVYVETVNPGTRCDLLARCDSYLYQGEKLACKGRDASGRNWTVEIQRNETKAG